MHKRLAAIAALLAGVWIATPTAAAAHLGSAWHGGPPPVGAGTGRLQVTGSEKQAAQGSNQNATNSAAAKPAGQTAPTAPLQRK
jgi:hypothetical protein